jgi:hypothetical protein
MRDRAATGSAAGHQVCSIALLQRYAALPLAETHSLRLEYASHVLRVACAEAAPLRWLEGFLTPAFARQEHVSPGEHAVTVEIDAVRYARRARARPMNALEIDCFTLDGRFLRYPSWVDDDGRRLIHDTTSEAFYSSTGDGEPALAILAARDGASLRRALLRVARELATAHALRMGHLHLHASAVAVGDRIVAFAGARESGKSTLLIHSLTCGGADYVSADRLLVAPAGAGTSARAMPTIVALRDGTLRYFPTLRARLAATGSVWFRTHAESAAFVPGRGPSPLERLPDGRFRGLSPSQLCELTDAGAIGSGALELIVFPRLAPDLPSYRLEALSPAEAARRIRSSLLLASVPERSAAAFPAGSPAFVRDADALDALSADLARRIPCMDLALGPDAYRVRPAARTLWDAVQDHLS